jgi:hypothetical protein
MSDDKPYPVRLLELHFLRSCVIAVPDHEAPAPGQDQPAISPTNILNVEPIEGEPHQFMVFMSCRSNTELDRKLPYSIDMECMARLATDGSLGAEDEIRAVTINGHSACYGAIREAVAWLTSRQPHGPVHLGLSVLRPKPAPASGAPQVDPATAPKP